MAVSELVPHWESFYVIVGSSGAALIGLQFVVMTLIAEMRTLSGGSVGAFGSPIVAHLGGALVISAIMSAPWPTLNSMALVLAAYGIGGVLYCAVVNLRARRQKTYRPVWQDWVWHVILPGMTYALLAIAAILLPGSPEIALFAIGTSALALLLIGIHNSWDTVTYIVLSRATRDKET